MNWTREDVRYAVATAAAVVLVGILAAGNFGLLPSPLPGVDRGPVDDVAVPVVAAGGPVGDEQPAGQAGDPAGIDEAASVLGGVVPAGSTTPEAGPTPAPADTTAPVTTFATPDGVIRVRLGAAPVTGTVTDEGSGVASVEVTFDNLTGTTVRRAKLTCDGAARRSCTWEANPPTIVGSYTVSARATDRAGNTESPGPEPITVTVVTTETSDGDEEDDDTGLVGGLVEGVTGLLGL